MRHAAHIASLVAWLLPLAAGCQNGSPFLTAQQRAGLTQQQQQASQPYLAQLQERERRLTQLDADNRDLQAQLARVEQYNQQVVSQLELVKQQLAETAALANNLQQSKQNAEQRVGGLLASTRQRGGATITANSSWGKGLEAIELPGIEVRRDADVIRIELPADQLFQPGTAQLLSGGNQLLTRAADSIHKNYPKHHIGIEGHTDNSPLYGGITSHQLSAAQAQAVFDQLTRSSGFPPNQLMTVAHGANHARVSNATPAGRAKNRRLELVIYPETIP